MADMASELEALAYRLRSAGQDDLARKLNAAMRDAVKPVPDMIRAGLKPHLPDPYAEVFDADLDIKTAARGGGGINTDAVVTVYARTRSGKRRRFKRLEDGVLEHPLFGNRKRFYAQTSHVVPGWFSGPASDDAPRVRAALEQALAGIADEVTKGA